MPRISVYSALSVLCLLSLLLAACGGKTAAPAGPLPRMQTHSGESVYLEVQCEDAYLQQDLHTMLRSYIEGETGLVVTDAPHEARVRLWLEAGKVTAAGTHTQVNTRHAALGMTAGSLTGTLVGLAADPHGYQGTVIGSSAGALAGLGLALMAGSDTSIAGWQLEARVRMARHGQEPDTAREHVILART